VDISTKHFHHRCGAHAVRIDSVLQYTVRRRVSEIGIRIALGAANSDVLGMVVAEGRKPILLGVAIGFAAAPALGGVVFSLLHVVQATDPLTFAMVALLLATVVPAYRAGRVEPHSPLQEAWPTPNLLLKTAQRWKQLTRYRCGSGGFYDVILSVDNDGLRPQIAQALMVWGEFGNQESCQIEREEVDQS
jgi:hypothetical protein